MHRAIVRWSHRHAAVLVSLRCLLAVGILALSGCASVPTERHDVFERGNALSVTVNQRDRQIEQFVDARALTTAPRIALPQVRVAADAYGRAVTPAQAALVANHAARSVCLGLSRYAHLQAQPAAGVLDAQLVVTAIKTTSSAAAGVSSVIDFFSPVPARLPAGLGGLAMEAELRDPQAGQVALMRWARGASSITQDAKVSAIGDAWQLAGRFGRDFSRALLDTDPTRRGLQRDRMPAATVKANRALCAQRYGTLRLAARGASFLLPLSPAAIDPGPPAAAQEPER